MWERSATSDTGGNSAAGPAPWLFGNLFSVRADPFPVGAVFNDPKRFVVPIYQRTYAWKIKPQLETFFAQVEAKARERLMGDGHYPHYMGAILVIPRGTYSFGQMTVLDVVDGQQRLTTFQLFLAALRDVARSIGETQPANLIEAFLLNPPGPQIRENIERYKLFPSAYDRALYKNLIDLNFESLRTAYPDHFYQNGKVRETAEPLLKAWTFFRGHCERFVFAENETDRPRRLNALSAAMLEGFQVIVITLGENDDAQVIFETLNAGGEPLAAMDLVRNDVFHRAAHSNEDVDVLMEQRWRLFEDPFWKKTTTRGRIKKPVIDFFLSDTLAAESGRESLETELYARYRDFVRESKFASVDAELATLLRNAPTYRILLEPQGTSALAWLARELAIFDVSTAFPLAFVIQASALPDEEKGRLYRLVVSYIVRRLLCGLTGKNYNNVFLRIASQLKGSGVSLDVARAAFAALEGDTVRFPTNAEVLSAIESRRQYGNVQQHRLRHILGQLELATRDRFDESEGLRDDLTIEHILPESWTDEWSLPDGTRVPSDKLTGMGEAQLKLIADREALKHTLGNLTLLTGASNASYSNDSFETKRRRLATSLLKENHEIASASEWNEEQIRQRAARLAQLALMVWPTVA